MELSLNIEQLQLKSEHLHANPKRIHYHENDTDPLFVSWDDSVTVLYPLNCLAEATLWNPVEPAILPLSDTVISVLTFDSNVYCIDKIGSIHHLKEVQRDSPDLFDYTSSSQVPQLDLSSNYEWKKFYSQKCPCDIFGATYYSNGISLIAKVDEWIIIQLLKITINDNNEPVVFHTCSKQIRPVKQFPFLVTSFISCTWKNWFSNQRVKELFGPSTLDSQDVFIFGTSESKIYFSTSDMTCKNVCVFLNCPQQIIHIQLCNFESKKLLLVSSSGILLTICCIENVPPSLIYLAVTKVVTTFIVDHTVIVSDGVYLFQITLDKDFSKIVKQIVTPLKGVLTLQKFQFGNIIAMTQLNKMYKLSPKYDTIAQEERFKFKLNNENSILEDIQNLCKGIESLEVQHEKINKYISAISIVARKDLVAQYCSLNVLLYSGTKAIQLGAKQDEYIVAIKLSTDCLWLSFPSTVWHLFVCITDTHNTSSDCGLHSFNTDLFDNRHPLLVKHHISASIIENCSSGSVYCALVCQIKNDLVNQCLVIPLSPVKLNSLYFVKVEKQEKVAVINPLENRHKYIVKFPENLSLVECLTNLTNRNKHRTSKSLIANIINDNMPKILYFNFFGIIVSIVLDDKITKTIIMECVDQDALITVRNGILDELSNNLPVVIKYSVLADVQKQLCLLEELSIKDQHDKNIVNEIKTKIQNQISTNLPV